MADMSSFGEGVFWGVDSSVDLYLSGKIPGNGLDFGISFDGIYSVVPFKVDDFATREIESCGFRYGKKVLDNWVEEGVGKIDRFISKRDLTTALKKGDKIDLFIDSFINFNYIKKGSFYICADSIKKYSVI